MSLKVLVIGRGSRASERVANEHELVFRPNAKPGPDFLSLEHHDFVFQHLSQANPEAADAVTEWINRGWKKRVVGFSGGEVPQDLKLLDVPQLQGLAGRESILDLAWSAVPSDFSGDARELLLLLKPSRHELLSALAILCQGYLAVYSYKHKADNYPAEAQEALAEMGLDKIVVDVSSELDNAGDVSVPTWWRRVFGGQRAETGKAISQEWGVSGIGECPPAIGDLIASIYSDQPIGAKVVGEAYLAVAKRMRG